jgi:ATP-dependent protease Clp ATPase subunit
MPDKELICSFCSQSEDDVKVLVAGPGISICDGCVAELMVIIAEDHPDWRDAQIERLSKVGK